MSRRYKMDSHLWLEIGTGYWQGTELELARAPQFSSMWASSYGCLCFLIICFLIIW